MSSKNNVNPDHYKVAGRDRPNETLPPKQPRVPDRRHAGTGVGTPNLIPGALPVGEAPAPARPRKTTSKQPKAKPTKAKRRAPARAGTKGTSRRRPTPRGGAAPSSARSSRTSRTSRSRAARGRR